MALLHDFRRFVNFAPTLQMRDPQDGGSVGLSAEQAMSECLEQRPGGKYALLTSIPTDLLSRNGARAQADRGWPD